MSRERFCGPLLDPDAGRFADGEVRPRSTPALKPDSIDRTLAAVRARWLDDVTADSGALGMALGVRRCRPLRSEVSIDAGLYDDNRLSSVSACEAMCDRSAAPSSLTKSGMRPGCGLPWDCAGISGCPGCER